MPKIEPKYDRVTFCGECQWELAFGIDLCPQCGAGQGPRNADHEDISDAPEDPVASGMVIATIVGLVMLIGGSASKGSHPLIGVGGYVLFSVGAGWLILRSAVKSAIISARCITHPDR